MRLAVELYGTVVGFLDGETRTFDFVMSDEAVAELGSGSTALSVTVPFTSRPVRHQAGRRRNWFAELLPEGDQLDHMVAQAGLRRGDVLGFLARYGRDVAGALQVWDVDDPSEPRTPQVRPIDAHEVRELLEDRIGAPLGNEPVLGKSSLGGVQPKIVLAWTDDGWGQVLGGFPSTHILKPQLDARSTVIFDEEYGARLVRAVGLAEFDARVETFAGLPALVVERFDRDGPDSEHPGGGSDRIHQEDFNQALGASGDQKYQEIGGVVSLARVAQVVDRHTGAASLNRLARMTVLTVGLGNLDMHTKNLGLLHPRSGDVVLAPAYDVVPTSRHPGSDGRLALAVNGVYRHSDVTQADLVAEVRSWGVRRPDGLVETTLDELREAARREAPLPGADPRIRADILRFTTSLLDGRGAGA